MLSRHAAILAAAAIGLAAFTVEASAQFFPATPYSYPSGGYRGVPDKNGVMTLAPDDEEEEEAPAPSARPPQSLRPGAPDPRGYRQATPYPESRAERDASAYPYNPRPNPPPGYVPVPDPYSEPRPSYYGHYGDRAPAERGTEPSMSAPGVIESRRPPTDIRPAPPRPPVNIASLPPEEQPEQGEPQELPPQFKRQMVDYPTREPAGTVVIDTANTYLYYVLGNGKAIRYGIGVGREGFTWAGTERISKMAEWPDWYPPAEMIERQPYLPRMMAGGPGNPLGARALYLGKTVYRIHGTNQPSTIGKFVSSGCIRMLNEDVEDLYNRTKVGSRVIVVAGNPPASAAVTR